MSNKPHLYLVRGLPGSGKSTFAQKLATLTGGKHFEADMFLYEDGVYTYDPSKLQEAHAQCLQSTIEALTDDGDIVIVSNVFSEEWMLAPYLDYCELNKIEFTVVKMEQVHGSVHDVPAEKMRILSTRWQNWVYRLINQEVFN